jgi:hypothetical protein
MAKCSLFFAEVSSARFLLLHLKVKAEGPLHDCSLWSTWSTLFLKFSSKEKKTVLNKAKRINTFASAAAFSVAAFSARSFLFFP